MPGHWKARFTAAEVKLIISQALNYCVDKEKMLLTGYFISYNNVCLVLKMEKRHLKRMLHTFYASVREVIIQTEGFYLEPEVINDEMYVQPKIDEQFSGLFTQYRFVDKYLIKLVTGQKVNLLYHDPVLERLKKKIHHYTYCSAINYAGGSGPVKVIIFKTEDV